MRRGSFALAARELNLSPSAVSHSVRGLEAYYGCPLFVRNGRRDVKPTLESLALAEVVAGTVSKLQVASDTLLSRTKRSVTVSALPSFAACWLLPRLGSFVGAHPDIDLAVRSTTSHVRFAAEGVDLAIRFGGGAWDGVDAEYLMGDQLYAVCSPKYQLEHGPLNTGSELSLAEWIEGDPEAWERWLEAAGVSMPPRKRRLYLGDASLALQAAISGTGVVVTRHSIAERDLGEGRLVRLLPSISASSQFSYYVVKPKGVALTAQAMLFENWLRENVGSRAAGEPHPGE